MDSVEATVEKILNYSFVNKTLLKEALTQTSKSCAESSPLSKRLEFLGDSVLEVAFTNYIHHAYPNLKLKELRKLRTANVSIDKFARVAVNHKLYQYFIHKPEKIIKFSEAVSKEDDPAPYGGLVKAPKLLADLVKSIAGAVYIDVKYDEQRLWEIFRAFLEPIYTPDDLRLQSTAPFVKLFRLADKHGKRIDFRYSKDDHGRKNIAEVYLHDIFIASGCDKRIDTAKLLAAERALQKLSDCMPIGKIIDEDSLDVELEDVKPKLTEICSTEKVRLQTGSSSLPTAPENPVTYEMTPNKMVTDEGSLRVEPEDVKPKLIEICSTEKLWLLTESSSFTDEMKQEQMVSPHVEPEEAKGMLFEICSKNKWPNPIFNVEEERGQKNENKFVCSVKIEIPTIEGTFHMKGDAKSNKRQAENSSAYHMIRALDYSLMSLFSSEMDSESVEAVEKILNYSFVNKNLLKEVLTPNGSPLYQQLMFVGGPALSLAFTKHLYLKYPKLEPNDLSLLRDENTCNDRYAHVAVKKGIYQFVIRNDPKKERMILEFIELMGKEDDPDPYRFVEAPKILAYLVYAVAGAVYIDVNYNVQRLWEIFRGLFEPIRCTLDDLRLQPKPPFCTLFHLADKHGKRIDFRYSKDDHSRKETAKVYLDDIFIASGCAKCKNTAKLFAAEEALQKLSECIPIEKIIDEDAPHVEPEDVKGKLVEICAKNMWPNPTFSVEEERGPKNELKFVCSVQIEIPTIEGKFHMKGDSKSTKKQAENSSACHMIRALNSSLMSLVISNLQMPESLDEKKKNLQMQESLDENKDMHSEKRKTRISTKKLQKRTGSSSLPLDSENPLTDETRQEQMVIDEDSRHVEHKDVNAKSFEICSTVKPRLQAESSSLPIPFENLSTDELTQEEIIVDENSAHIEPEDAKGKLFEIYSTKKLQTETGSSLLPTASENPSTYEMTTKKIVVDRDSLQVETEDVKGKLFEICSKNMWPNPIFSVEEERGPTNELKFLCSVQIEIPTIEGKFYMKGDSKSMKTKAENSSAYHMIRALNSPLMSLVISNLQMPESLDEKKNLHSKKRKII